MEKLVCHGIVEAPQVASAGWQGVAASRRDDRAGVWQVIAEASRVARAPLPREAAPVVGSVAGGVGSPRDGATVVVRQGIVEASCAPEIAPPQAAAPVVARW